MKNFKCQNTKCGVSFKADKQGPCPVCGCEITKPEKSNKVLIIFTFLFLVSTIVLFVIFKDVLSVSKQEEIGKTVHTEEPATETTEEPAATEDSLLCDYSDVRLTKPIIKKEENKVIIELASSSRNCDFLYSLNQKIQKSKIFTISSIDFKKFEYFDISVSKSDGSLLTSKKYKNPHFIKKINCDDLKKYIEKFKKVFNLYLNDFKEEGESDRNTELVSIFEKKNRLHLDPDNFKLNVNYKNSKSSTEKSLNGILTDLENDGFSEIYYKAEFEFVMQTDDTSGKCSVKKIDINLSKI